MPAPARSAAADSRERRRAIARSARPRSRVPETGDEPDLPGQYLAQIAATPLLTAEDEVRLARRIEAGVHAAGELERADAGEHGPTAHGRRELEAAVRSRRRAPGPGGGRVPGARRGAEGRAGHAGAP
ncbi:sigma-70 factor domain-containing protein [Streptomyces sp. NPDC004457]